VLHSEQHYLSGCIAWGGEDVQAGCVAQGRMNRRPPHCAPLPNASIRATNSAKRERGRGEGGGCHLIQCNHPCHQLCILPGNGIKLGPSGCCRCCRRLHITLARVFGHPWQWAVGGECVAGDRMGLCEWSSCNE
jgi:hypothetical protein